MPSIIDLALIDPTVYWEPFTNEDGYPDGGKIASAPVEILSRWVEHWHNRLQADESEIYIGADVLTGGFLLLGSLDELLPENAAEYPPTAPFALTEYTGRWQFNDDLLAEFGPNFAQNSGTSEFITGVNGGQALSNNTGVVFANDIETVGDVEFNGSNAFSICFWLHLQSPSIDASASPAASPSFDTIVTMSIGGLTIEIGIDEIRIGSGVWEVSGLDGEWNQISVVSKAGGDLRLFVAGVEVDPTTPQPSPLSSIDETASISWFNDDDSYFGIDELITYSESLDAFGVQMMAVRNPLNYKLAKEIIRTQFARSSDGKRRVRRVVLKGNPQ